MEESHCAPPLAVFRIQRWFPPDLCVQTLKGAEGQRSARRGIWAGGAVNIVGAGQGVACPVRWHHTTMHGTCG